MFEGLGLQVTLSSVVRGIYYPGGISSRKRTSEAGREHVVCAKGPGLFALSAGMTAVSAVLQMNHFNVTKNKRAIRKY